MPPPGPELFHARRYLWLQPGPNRPLPAQPYPPRDRLESLLATPGAIESDATWRAGLEGVWNGLVGDGHREVRLKHRLPLGLVIKILQAGWIREGTWPRGAIAPASDDELEPDVSSPGQTSVFSPTA
ncbi:hypothetical protein C8Q77DRAFT_405521 [Trametes polyzona]|nr:hypothetical protein C8Q77DRAFT_405521 [Trametes polyzona]